MITPISLANPEALLGKLRELTPKDKLEGLNAASFEDALGASLKAGAAGVSAPRGLESPGAVSFPNMLENAVYDINGKMQASRLEQQKLLTGETTNVHQAMIASQESGVAFQLMVEVRTKLVESYQELMRMQV